MTSPLRIPVRVYYLCSKYVVLTVGHSGIVTILKDTLNSYRHRTAIATYGICVS